MAELDQNHQDIIDAINAGKSDEEIVAELNVTQEQVASMHGHIENNPEETNESEDDDSDATVPVEDGEASEKSEDTPDGESTSTPGEAVAGEDESTSTPEGEDTGEEAKPEGVPAE